MQSFAAQEPELSQHVLAHREIRGPVHRGVLFLAASAMVAAQLLLGWVAAAQAPAAPAQASRTAPETAHPISHPAAHRPTHRTAQARHKALLAKTTVPPAPTQTLASAPVVPAAPPMPNWPVNDKPVEATVVWDSQGLLVKASNSSLDQILKDVSLKIGAKVEGLGADQRVFGTYGPGPARVVLSEILDGSGYNILMIGDQGAGTPRRIVLSGRPTGPAPPRANNNPGFNNDGEPEYDPDAEPRPYEPNPVMPPAPGMAPGMPVRTPQQMQQLMEERQRQIQQQQQNNQQNTEN